MSNSIDAIVVGLGIAGGALAYSLGRAGKRVVAFERDLSEPDKIIGEVLQPGGVERLRRMGLEEVLEGIDSPKILGYAVFPEGKEAVGLSYPKIAGATPRGRSFHHGRLIQNLRKKARETAEVREATVTKLLQDEKTGRVIGVEWKARSDGSKGQTFADYVFVCDGLFSNFRDFFSPDDKVTHGSKFVGLLLKDAASLMPFPNHGHVFLIKPTPTLMYPISSTEVRALVDIPEPVPKNLEETKAYLKSVTAPQLPESIRQAFLDAVDSEKMLRSMPCGKLHSKPRVRPGAMLIGDALNVRHPLTGGGMTVAFNDVWILSETMGRLPSLRDERAVGSVLTSFFSTRKQLAAQINILAQALYEVFSHDNLRKAVVGYFLLGGEAVNGPMALLGGLTPSPAYLLAHFFAVAFYGCGSWLFPFPWPSNVANAFDTIYSATKLILPLANGEHLFDPTYPRAKL